MRGLLCLGIVVLMSIAASAQQTIYNVPSADVLERGKVYGEFDATYQNSSGAAAFTPRLVLGVGRDIEVGLNANGFGTPGPQSFTPTPTVKWKFYDGKQNGWSLLAGDDVFIPAQHRGYNVGNYAWAEGVRSWNSGTRATLGVYHITEKVVAARQKVGVQAAFEQTLNGRATFAADWFSGESSIGYVTPGIIVKVTRQLTWYGSYQLGNSRLTEGNHQFLFEIGWNFN